MKKTAIGHVRCPVCDFSDAEVKEDKNGHAYIHCTDCNAQTFTRNDFRDGQLRRRMRAVTVTGTGGEAPPAPAPAAAAAPAKPAAAPAPAKPAAKKSWLTPLMAGGGNG